MKILFKLALIREIWAVIKFLYVSQNGREGAQLGQGTFHNKGSVKNRF